MSQHSQSSEEEPSAVEYARANGLSRNYLAEALGISDLQQLQSSLQDALSDSHLHQFNLGPPLKVEERLNLSKDAATLLQSVMRGEVREDIDALVTSTPNAEKRRRPSKLELPLLRTDHATDCRSFGSREGFDIKLQDVKLPLELVDDEKNEGFIYPQRFWDIGPQILHKLKTEKLSATKETVKCIADSIAPAWSEEDAKALWDGELKYKRNLALEPVTPPLSPAFKPLPQPYEPTSSDSAYELPILSDPVSPTKQELEAIEKIIFEQDVATPLRKARDVRASKFGGEVSSDTLTNEPVISLGDIYTPLASMENTPPSVQEKRIKREDLKVEETLTPESGITLPKCVRFSDIIEELELDPESRMVTPTDANKFFQDTFGDALAEANQRAEQEKLVVEDVTARVDVPLMDFSKADPPWKKFEQVQNKATLAAMQLSFMQDVLGQRLPKPVHFDIKTIQLKWNPIPQSLAKVAEEEHYTEDDHHLETFLKDMESGEIITSSSLTWKPEGLKILKHDEEDDEIDPGQFRRDSPRDLSSLVKKRKMELQEVDEAREERASKKAASGPGRPSQDMVKHNNGREGQLKRGGQSFEPGLLLGGEFSAESCLDNFLELRGTKKAKLTDSNYFTSNPDNAAPAAPTLRTMTPGNMQLPIRVSPIAKAAPLPAPSLPAVPPATSILVSSTLLKHRALIKNLERLLPALNIIERDFTAHNTTAWQPGSVTRSPIKSSLDSEADLIVSASTGMVITTLQKIKQKSLPGQNTQPAIRDRLERVSGRYEKLIVLITEGRGDETTIGLDESDCLAYSEFAGFVAGFETSIQALFVAGGEETLSKWLASTIVQHCGGEAMNLLVEETHWEVFLRRAGLNAFAAQAVLEILKPPNGIDPASLSKAGQFGLTAFIEMGQDQRIERFGPVCGTKLIAKVSSVIDAKWD